MTESRKPWNGAYLTCTCCKLRAWYDYDDLTDDRTEYIDWKYITKKYEWECRACGSEVTLTEDYKLHSRQDETGRDASYEDGREVTDFNEEEF